MELIAPSNRDLCCPFRIGKGPNERGPRIGGHAPALVVQPRLSKLAKYVLTFPISHTPTRFVSVYVNCDFDALGGAMNTGIMSDDRVVGVLHDDTGRLESNRFQSDLTPHPLIVGTITTDHVDNGEGELTVLAGHKFGGRPYCIQEPELDGAEALLDDGYIQALQLDFPNARDANISGDWPFADGLFNFFLKPTGEGSAYWAFQK